MITISAGQDSKDLYLLVDGENIDGTLGSIIGHQPTGEDRPRWDRVLDFAKNLWSGRNVKPFFFHNATSYIPWPFIQALKSIGFRTVLLTGPEGTAREVVDEGIQKMLAAIAEHEGDVLLMSHDGSYRDYLEELSDGRRHIAMLVFKEYIAGGYKSVTDLELFDLEEDARAFQSGPLPRDRQVSIDEFNPEDLL